MAEAKRKEEAEAESKREEEAGQRRKDGRGQPLGIAATTRNFPQETPQ